MHEPQPPASKPSYNEQPGHARLNSNRLLNRAVLIWKGLTVVVLNLVGLFLFAMIVALLIEVLADNTVVVDPIIVPSRLRDNGYTEEVASRRLRDALVEYEKIARKKRISLRFASDPDVSSLAVPAIQLNGDLPSFVVPTVGLSIESIGAYIRTFFGNSRRRNISGEITVWQERLLLRLRMNGVEFYASDASVDQDAVDDLFVAAAPKVFEATEPFLAAAALSDVDPTESLAFATRIIAKEPAWNSNVVSSHNLIGLMHYNKWRMKEAVNEFKLATSADNNFVEAYNNLGIALREDGELDDAIGAFNKAIEVDPHFAAAHINLATILRALENEELAKAEFEAGLDEFRLALKREPNSSIAHNNVGFALRALEKTADAANEFRRAIDIDQNYAVAHRNLADAFQEMNKRDEAVSEMRRATAIDTSLKANLDLALLLFEQHKDDAGTIEVQSAIVALKDTIKADDQDAFAHQELGRALSLIGDSDGAIASYTKALEITANYAAALVYRGASFFSIGRFADAASDLKGAAQSQRANPYFKLLLYVARARLGDHGAQKELEINFAKAGPSWPMGPLSYSYINRHRRRRLASLQTLRMCAKPTFMLASGICYRTKILQRRRNLSAPPGAR